MVAGCWVERKQTNTRLQKHRKCNRRLGLFGDIKQDVTAKTKITKTTRADFRALFQQQCFNYHKKRRLSRMRRQSVRNKNPYCS